MGLNPLAAAGAGLGLIGAIGGMFANKKSNKELKKLEGQNVQYKANPLADERLNLAKSMLNARMPGAAYLQQNIFSSQANQMANINQNATDSSQALALAAGSQGQTNEALARLGMTEQQDYQRRYGNLVNAQDNSIQEGDKVFQDQVRNFQDRVQFAGARAANRSNAWNSLTGIGLGTMDMGLAGGGWGRMSMGRGRGGGTARIGMSPVYQNLADETIQNQFHG